MSKKLLKDLNKLLIRREAGENVDYDICKIQSLLGLESLPPIDRTPPGKSHTPKDPNSNKSKKKCITMVINKSKTILSDLTIAVDVCVSKRESVLLQSLGAKVIEAEHSESDDSWMDRTLNKNPDIIISLDKQVLQTARIAGALPLDYIPKLRQDRFVEYVTFSYKSWKDGFND